MCTHVQVRSVHKDVCVCLWVCIGKQNMGKSISETLASGCSFIIAVTGQSVSVRGATLDDQSPHDQSLTAAPLCIVILLASLSLPLFFSKRADTHTHRRTHN